MELAILGWGTALPGAPVDLADAVKMAITLDGLTADQARALPILYRRTGIKTKHSVLTRVGVAGEPVQDFYQSTASPGGRGPTTLDRMRVFAEQAPPLAREAASQALAESGVPPAAITHLVTVTCTGFTAPGFDIDLIRSLGLPSTTERVQVGFMGCHGALNGLKAARGLLAAAGPEGRVLLCATELCSLHYQYGWDPDRVVANALFADGSAAAVLGSGERTKRTDDHWRMAATGSCLFPDSSDAMTWTVGDHGFEMTLSARVPDLIGRGLRPWLEPWLAGQGLALDSVGSWAIHPGGPRIISAAEQALGLDSAATAVSRDVLRRCGNMSSPTILFILRHLAAAGAPRPCVALAFGPGLVAEAALFR